MGIKGPPLPAPTETDSNTGREETELESRVTEATDKTTYSLHSDGSPVTIPTKKRDHKGKGLTSNKSQTSLLIEYFEGGKPGQPESRKPSVRVKVTPSSKSRSRSEHDHIQITERKGTRKPSYTKRIQLSPNVKGDGSALGEEDDNSLLSYRSATEESNVTSRGGRPIDIEIMPRRHGSPLIPTGEESSTKYVQQNASDISSMPADSFLDGKTKSPQRKRSRSLSRGEALATGAASSLAAGAVVDKLKTKRSRSLSRERIVVQKVAEKVRGDKPERRRKHRSRSRSVSGEHLTEGIKSPRRRSSRSHHEESNISGTTSSILNSQVSGRSGDQYSMRSGTSKASINNPKLLETVEDAIRRLILPELTALKRDQSQRLEREQRDRRRRGSVTSGSAISRDSIDESSSVRRSDRGSVTDLSSKPRVTLNDGEVGSSKNRKERNKNIDRVKHEDSPGSFERETSEETVVQDGKKKRHRGLEAAAIGAGVGALTAAALHKHHSEDSISIDEKKDRRRRRTKSRSRSDSMTESYEEREHHPAPPMPLMSDINASELTRSSILSASTERPHSASQEHQVTPVREVARGVASPSSLTPTRTPVALQQGLGTQHSNYSRGNLSLHSQPSERDLRTEEYELDEHGRKVPMHGGHDDQYLEEEEEQKSGGHGNALAAGAIGAIGGAGLATMYHQNQDHEDPELMEDEEQYDYYQNHQEVPPPLRYVPYGHQGRGLSPIQSVSGYTEGDPEPQRDSRLTHSTGSYSSMGKSAQHKHSGRSMRSLDSVGNIHGNQHDFPGVRQGGLTDSELTQDGEYWEEQHRENDRNRDIDAESYRSSDPRIDYKRMTNFTDDSMDAPELDRVAAGQNVRGVGANPDYVHTPVAVESAVASLVNASDLTGPTGHYDRRGSYASFDDGSDLQFTSRGNSPTKRNTFGSSQQGSSQQNSPTKYDEYELDEQGRKVTMPNYKKTNTAGNAVLAGIAAGAAAHVLKGRNKKSDADQIRYESLNADTGAPLHKSFKERAMEGQGQVPLSPRHSIDAALSEVASHEHLKMGASGIPDSRDPMPEIGYGDAESEVDTNPSIIQGPIGGVQGGNQDHWPGHQTPPRKLEIRKSRSAEHDANVKAAEAALVGAAAGAGAAALAGHNRDVSRETNDEDWQRSSGDRKRDTLITNPYEGTSPIAAIGNTTFDLQPTLLGAREFGTSQPGYQTGSPVGLPKDEGYISSAPNAGAISPEPRIKGVNFIDQELEGSDGENPFYTPKHARHLSGLSAGMESPLYDSATGNGIDRIQSKDIIALMDHLTVRDAQRSARDTEILVTLVRVAAEMRNSFSDMRNLLGDSEDVIINEVQMNTDRSVQKAINGPRPLPPSAARSLRQGSHDEMFEDPPTKRRNVFRRALKGLSMKSSNDLGKIEDMLVQLLGDVEGLKVAQGLQPGTHPANSYDDLQQEGNYENDRGYEPEGNAGTSTASHASQSGHLSIPIRGTSATRPYDSRKFSDHRISTVPEGDEDELDQHEQAVLDNAYENNEQLLTPTRENIRGGSAPLGTPPQQQVPLASLSNENTPRTDKSKKHKSSSSSGWIPKVSRWSETTASTVFRGFRNSARSSARKENDQFEQPPSRSGSDLGNYAENDPYGDDRLQYSPERQQLENEASPSLLPPEDPKYKAKRISLTIEHPQPRPGPTHRYQTALESQAVNFGTPMSPTSANWSQTSLNRLPVNQNRYSDGTNATNHTGRMSPASEGGYSNRSAANQAPTRPPKEPIAPQLPPKIRTKLQKPSPLSNEHLSPERQYSPGGAYETGSPRPAIRSLSGTLGGVPTRKPTGPRSMSSASKSGDLNRDDGTVRRNQHRDTFGTVASNHSGESETF